MVKLILVLVLSLASLTTKAAYIEHITNGGFESGALSGWYCEKIFNCSVSGFLPLTHSGDYHFRGFHNFQNLTMEFSQDIATQVGAT